MKVSLDTIVASYLPNGARAYRVRLDAPLPQELHWLNSCTSAWVVASKSGSVIGLLARSSQGWSWNLLGCDDRFRRSSVFHRSTTLRSMAQDCGRVLKTERVLARESILGLPRKTQENPA